DELERPVGRSRGAASAGGDGRDGGRGQACGENGATIQGGHGFSLADCASLTRPELHRNVANSVERDVCPTWSRQIHRIVKRFPLRGRGDSGGKCSVRPGG